MVLCLSKTPGGLIKSGTANSEAGARIGGAGGESINRRTLEEEEEDIGTATQPQRKKGSKIFRSKKDKNSEEKGRWDNLI